MTFKYRHRKAIIIISLIIILIGGSITYLVTNKKTNKKEIVLVKNKLEKKSSTKEKKEEPSKELLKVDIKGEIINPGIYSLEKDSRVIDVINLAGGLTENADTSVINLSKKIIDEMVIIVYSRSQVEDFKKTKEIEKQVQEKCREIDENALINDACIDSNTSSTKKISINSGTLEELKTLKGIGEAKAQDIINYRETNGPFQTIEDLKNIPGIGENLFASIKEDITL